jgi:hypothetical protein
LNRLKVSAAERVIVGVVLIILLVKCGHIISAEEKQELVIRESIHRFFTLVHQGKYRDAYDLFSRSIRRDLTYLRFREGAQDIKYLKILSINIDDIETNLAKTRISTLVHLVYKGDLFEAVYEGQVTLYREKNNWKVLSVSLEAKSQKSLGKKVEPGQLQKLDFGTK